VFGIVVFLSLSAWSKGNSKNLLFKSSFLVNFDSCIYLLVRYGKVMKKLLNNSFGYLLASLEREFKEQNMLPHSASFQDTVDYFGDEEQ